MVRRPRIALLIDSYKAYGRGLLSGIADYAHTHGPWTFFHEERSLGDSLPPAMKNWKPDGLIARIVNDRIGRQIRRLGLPTVDLLLEVSYPEIPRVIQNQEAVVRLAVDHLRERRFREFAFVGFSKIQCSEARRRHFLAYAQQLGLSTHVFEDQAPTGFLRTSFSKEMTARQMRRLAAWLRRLPKPAGVIAYNDLRAFHVLGACGEHGIQVPDMLAVIGVDDDPVLCELSDPPLSSVIPNVHRIGFEGAAILHQLLSGKRVPSVTSIEPVGVHTRRSTDILAIDDAEFVDVLRYVRENACRGLTVETLAKRLAISRSTLVRWFEKDLGHSPREEIMRVQLASVKELLATKDYTIEDIACLTGFAHPETLHRVFLHREGLTPNAYRKKQRRHCTPSQDFFTNHAQQESAEP
jgi:LacI family transcriptional regulator